MPNSYSMTAAVGFGASHVLKDHPTCGRMHGHSYYVRVTFTGDPEPTNWSFPFVARPEDITKVLGIVLELSSKHLNDMIPAGNPSAAGVAGYLLERLQIHGVTKVEVHESDTDVTATVERLPG